MSSGLAAAAIFAFGPRRRHAIFGGIGALAGGGLWLGVAALAAFVWIPFVPDRCTSDWLIHG